MDKSELAPYSSCWGSGQKASMFTPEAFTAYLHLYVRIYQVCLVLSILQAWLSLTDLLIQWLYSSTGYRSSFNSSLLAHLSIPSPLLPLLWLLLSTPLSGLSFWVPKSQITHTRFLIFTRKRVDQDHGLRLFLLNCFMTTDTNSFSLYPHGCQLTSCQSRVCSK